VTLGRVALSLVASSAAVAQAQSQGTAAPLVFDGVTVIDVVHGTRIPAQRVVIVGSRIQRMGDAKTVAVPPGAQLVNGQGKYLIPGLWDMHVHMRRYQDFFYPLFLANGVTGIRDAGSEVPLDTLVLWRREVITGARVGPPRQLLSGPAVDEFNRDGKDTVCIRRHHTFHICVADSADARHVVDSLKAAGADLIKTYGLKQHLYFVIAAEARRIGIPFGGHLTAATAIEASDSGAGLLDHANSSGDLDKRCLLYDTASVAQCQPLAERFRQNGTWWLPTLTRSLEGADELGAELGLPLGPAAQGLYMCFFSAAKRFWAGAVFHPDQLSDSTRAVLRARTAGDSTLNLVQRVGLPILAGTDGGAPVMTRMPPGFSLHGELAMYVAEGLTPLETLQAATLNPAKYLRGTDSLGTVAPGKLADLVLLDGDPLTDITNTIRIRAVVANGRYFDRAALDQLLAAVQAKAKQEPQPLGVARENSEINAH
jgi:hypothetical protein